MSELPWVVEGFFDLNSIGWGVRARCVAKDIADTLVNAARRDFPKMQWRVRDTRLDAPTAPIGKCDGCDRPATHRDGKYACCGAPQHCVAAIPPAPLDCAPDVKPPTVPAKKPKCCVCGDTQVKWTQWVEGDSFNKTYFCGDCHDGRGLKRTSSAIHPLPFVTPPTPIDESPAAKPPAEANPTPFDAGAAGSVLRDRQRVDPSTLYVNKVAPVPFTPHDPDRGCAGCEHAQARLGSVVFGNQLWCMAQAPMRSLGSVTPPTVAPSFCPLRKAATSATTPVCGQVLGDMRCVRDAAHKGYHDNGDGTTWPADWGTPAAPVAKPLDADAVRAIVRDEIASFGERLSGRIVGGRLASGALADAIEYASGAATEPSK